MYSILSIIEEATIHQTFSEIAGDIALHNALFGSSSTFVRDSEIYVALKNFIQFLHKFSFFDTIFPCFDYQKLILMQNEYDIRNQHKKLHQIARILSKYFFYEISTCIPPQVFSPYILSCGPPQVQIWWKKYFDKILVI